MVPPSSLSWHHRRCAGRAIYAHVQDLFAHRTDRWRPEGSPILSLFIYIFDVSRIFRHLLVIMSLHLKYYSQISITVAMHHTPVLYS